MVVAWLLLGFTVGGHFGVAAWAVTLAALAGLATLSGRLPWRAVPVAPAVLAVAVGTLAVSAIAALQLDRLFAVDGRSGEAAVFAPGAIGANVMHNLPATVAAERQVA